MTTYRIIKIGIEPLDVLRAYGLALLLASITKQAVLIEDSGYSYLIRGASYADGSATPVIAMLLPKPEANEFLQYSAQTQAIFDGILSLLFTTPGPRILGMDDMRFIAPDDHDRITALCNKIHAYLKRILHTVRKIRLSDIIVPYRSQPTPTPILVQATKSTLNFPMVIAAQVGYSLRSPSSNGIMGHRINITLQGEQFGVLLAIIGATRFLRAQRVAQNQVLLTAPLIKTLTVHADTIRPIERRRDQSSRHCLAIYALTYALAATDTDGQWQGIAYQCLQTQGTQQSISILRGELSLVWLLAVQQVRSALLKAWLRLLRADQRTIPIEQFLLLEVILERSGNAWMRHLSECAITYRDDEHQYTYTIDDLWEVTPFMTQTQETQALTAILRRKEGTLRFGRALRQLGRTNLATLRDLHMELASARSIEALLSILTTITLESELASDRHEFIVVPNEDDLDLLLQDCTSYGVVIIARLITVLSVVRYPRVTTPEQVDSILVEA